MHKNREMSSCCQLLALRVGTFGYRGWQRVRISDRFSLGHTKKGFFQKLEHVPCLIVVQHLGVPCRTLFRPEGEVSGLGRNLQPESFGVQTELLQIVASQREEVFALNKPFLIVKEIVLNVLCLNFIGLRQKFRRQNRFFFVGNGGEGRRRRGRPGR